MFNMNKKKKDEEIKNNYTRHEQKNKQKLFPGKNFAEWPPSKEELVVLFS